MPREGVPYPERVLCSLKNTIAMIEQKLGLKIEKINGVGPDPSGNVTIVSDDAALTIEEDAAQHQVTIGLDRSELPSAAVASVNGETGAVVLDASEIPYNDPDGYTDDVDEKLNVLTGVQNALQLSINQERTRAQNAESGLQTNINASNLRISNIENAISADPDPDTIGLRDANGRLKAADPASGATDKTLVTANWVSQTGNSSPNNLVHRGGNETISGEKIFSGYYRLITSNRADHYDETTFMDPTTAPNGDYFIYREALKVGTIASVKIDALRILKDNNGTAYYRNIGLFGNQYGNNCGITFVHYEDGRPDKVQIRVKNANGTVKTITIAEGDP